VLEKPYSRIGIVGLFFVFIPLISGGCSSTKIIGIDGRDHDRNKVTIIHNPTYIYPNSSPSLSSPSLTSEPSPASYPTPNPSPSSLFPSFEDFFEQGKSYFYVEKYAEAESKFTNSINNKTIHIPSYIWRGITRIRINRCEEAISDFKNAISIDPHKGVAYAYLGFLQAYFLGKPKLAHQSFAQAKSKIRDSKAHEEINYWLRAIDSQVKSNNLPKLCPIEAFSPQQLNNSSLLETVH